MKFEDDPGAAERARAAQKKKQKAKVEPTWEEAWSKVLELKSTDPEKALAVKVAVEMGRLSLGIQSLKKLSWASVKDKYFELQRIEKAEYLAEMVRNTPENYYLIQTEAQLEKLLIDLNRETIFAVDTETTGLDVYRDVIVGISFTLPEADYHVYIPVGHKTAGVQLNREYVIKKLSPILESPFIGKVFHNAKFDFHMFIRHGLKVRGLIHDTIVAAKVLNENEDSVALKNLIKKYGRYMGIKSEAKTFEELFGKNAKFAEVALDVALVYACKDTHYTWELYKFQKKYLKELSELNRLYREIENPLIEVCVEMEQTGFLIDQEFAKVYGVELKAEIVDLEKQLRDHFGEDVNFNSPSQLAKIFYDEMGLPDPKKKRSTDVKTLKKLKNKFAGIEPLLKYRELEKLRGTYVEALPERIGGDGRLHGSFNQLNTVTGRFASDNPNLQNLPPRARRLIVAPEGYVIMGTDYSQIEPRVLSHMSGDRHLQEAYLKGEDLYSAMASRIFKVPIELCGDGSTYRKKMKIGLLAVMYGVSMWTLAEQLGITVKEAYQFIQDFYEAYPDVYEFIRETWEFVKNNEYVLTLYHRKRRFPGHREQARAYERIAKEICKYTKTREVPFDFWDHKEIPRKLKYEFQRVKGAVESVRRMAVNARIQGSAADIMKKALIAVYTYTQKKNWRVNGTVHDESLLLVPETITLQEVNEIETLMLGAARLEVPVKVDTEFYRRWGDGIKKGEWFKLAA
jgi:DNA polymerase-1